MTEMMYCELRHISETFILRKVHNDGLYILNFCTVSILDNCVQMENIISHINQPCEVLRGFLSTLSLAAPRGWNHSCSLVWDLIEGHGLTKWIH